MRQCMRPPTIRYNRFVRRRLAGVWRQVVDARQIVRVHQEAASVALNKKTKRAGTADLPGKFSRSLSVQQDQTGASRVPCSHSPNLWSSGPRTGRDGTLVVGDRRAGRRGQSLVVHRLFLRTTRYYAKRVRSSRRSDCLDHLSIAAVSMIARKKMILNAWRGCLAKNSVRSALGGGERRSKHEASRPGSLRALISYSAPAKTFRQVRCGSAPILRQSLAPKPCAQALHLLQSTTPFAMKWANHRS